MKNKIEDLHNHLFQQLENLNDDEKMKNPITRQRQLEVAREVANIGRVIVDSAKVEVQFLDVVGGKGTGFIPTPGNALPEGEQK